MEETKQRIRRSQEETKTVYVRLSDEQHESYNKLTAGGYKNRIARLLMAHYKELVRQETGNLLEWIRDNFADNVTKGRTRCFTIPKAVADNAAGYPGGYSRLIRYLLTTLPKEYADGHHKSMAN